MTINKYTITTESRPQERMTGVTTEANAHPNPGKNQATTQARRRNQGAVSLRSAAMAGLRARLAEGIIRMSRMTARTSAAVAMTLMYA
jgi:hypothetical protein